MLSYHKYCLQKVKKSVDIHETMQIGKVVINQRFLVYSLPLDEILNELKKL